MILGPMNCVIRQTCKNVLQTQIIRVMILILQFVFPIFLMNSIKYTPVHKKSQIYIRKLMGQSALSQTFLRFIKCLYAIKQQYIFKTRFLNISVVFNLKILTAYLMISILPNEKHTAFKQSNKVIYNYLSNKRQRA